jgi:hypothetical protein
MGTRLPPDDLTEAPNGTAYVADGGNGSGGGGIIQVNLSTGQYSYIDTERPYDGLIYQSNYIYLSIMGAELEAPIVFTGSIPAVGDPPSLQVAVGERMVATVSSFPRASTRFLGTAKKFTFQTNNK